MMVAAPEIPSPSEWGWKKKSEGGWQSTGLLYQKTQLLVENLYAVVAKKVVKDTANVRRQL